jgi:hypothetical protein
MESLKPTRSSTYSREAYLRARDTRRANQKRYYDAHVEERRKIQREYMARKRAAESAASSD